MREGEITERLQVSGVLNQLLLDRYRRIVRLACFRDASNASKSPGEIIPAEGQVASMLADPRLVGGQSSVHRARVWCASIAAEVEPFSPKSVAILLYVRARSARSVGSSCA